MALGRLPRTVNGEEPHIEEQNATFAKGHDDCVADAGCNLHL